MVWLFNPMCVAKRRVYMFNFRLLKEEKWSKQIVFWAGMRTIITTHIIVYGVTEDGGGTL